MSWSHIIVVVVPVGLLVLLSLLHVPICPSRHLFGVPCPGCGLTRATGAMLTLDFGTAMRMHPLAPIIVPLVGWMLGRVLLIGVGVLPRSTPDPITRLPQWAWLLLLILVLGVWGLRLAGYLGGHPDPVDPASGWFARAFADVFSPH